MKIHLSSWKTTTLFIFLLCSTTSFASEPVWDGNTVVLKVQQIDNGVYVFYDGNAAEYEPKGLPLATSGGFIVGDKGVLLIDTMLNKRLYLQTRQFIRTVTSKPILYAVNTSYHGDHSYGNMYLPKNTRIVQHVVTQNYIQRHFVKDTEFMMKHFGTGRGIEQIKPVPADILLSENGRLTLDLGNKTVQIIDFGFAQTGGDLFVWEPDSKTLWTGNPIITVKPSLPWLLDGHLLETLASLKNVFAFLPDDARVVPGHGRPMLKSDLMWHIQYLEDVKTEVQKAIEEGLSAEQTVKKLSMTRYQGYALFDWVHYALNVPAAYKDLSQAKP